MKGSVIRKKCLLNPLHLLALILYTYSHSLNIVSCSPFYRRPRLPIVLFEYICFRNTLIQPFTQRLLYVALSFRVPYVRLLIAHFSSLYFTRSSNEEQQRCTTLLNTQALWSIEGSRA